MKAFATCILTMASAAAIVLAVPAQSVRAADCRASAGPGVDWQECDKKLLMLGESDLSKAKLLESDFSATDLRGANLSGANLEKSRLVRATLAGAKADGADFARVEAYRTDFGGIQAKDASFESAELQRSNFKGATLLNGNFTKADLGRSQFEEADIGGSRFAMANLARADFRSAKFSNRVDFNKAFLFLTRLEGVDLSAATGLVQWQLDMACGDDKTRLPSGLTQPARWPCNFQQE